jgi:ABC-type sugar transport system ATPase subunit
MTSSAEAPSPGEPALKLSGISKRFGAVTALEDVSIELAQGETLGIVGDNGAGKSTLLKIMSGVHRPDAGTMEVDGKAVRFNAPGDARAAGIEAVYQDLALVDDMTVAENMFLGRETMRPGILGRLGVIDHRTMREKATETIAGLRVRIPGMAEAIVRQMSGGQRQGAAISRAILWGRKVLLLDEPTAALGVKEQAEVERMIKDLHSQRLPMILIAHNMPLVFRLTDRIAVLRHGRLVATLHTARTTPEEVVGHITGALAESPAEAADA